ncbi:5304_t:CDS:2, partial [Cetraspora pellucida]
DRVYLILEYAARGELYKYLVKYKRFPERLAAKYISQIADALAYLQEKNVIHRDMKPENLLLSEDGNVKISDFGLAIHAPNQQRRMTFCGTLDYLAPEMVMSTGHDGKIDSWALGVLCYEFLVGEPPFADMDSEYNTRVRIAGVDLKLPHDISLEAKDLITSVMKKSSKLEYDHPVCSGILDYESEPISTLLPKHRDMFQTAVYTLHNILAHLDESSGGQSSDETRQLLTSQGGGKRNSLFDCIFREFC